MFADGNSFRFDLSLHQPVAGVFHAAVLNFNLCTHSVGHSLSRWSTLCESTCLEARSSLDVGEGRIV